MVKLAAVTPLYDETLLDVPGKLRRLADDIDALPITVQVALVTFGDDGLKVYAFGATTAADAHLMFGAPQHQLQEACHG